jgi:hypothetical protein
MRRAIRVWIRHPIGVPACIGVFYSLDAALAYARTSVFHGKLWIA